MAAPETDAVTTSAPNFEDACLYSRPVERQLKERLVGAAVLVAAAVILIPEMLSGPKRESRATPTAASSADGSLKTYTIDLNRSPGTPPAVSGSLDERAPPPESETSQSGESEQLDSTSVPAPEAPAPQASPERSEVRTAQIPPPLERTPTEPASRTPPSASTLTDAAPPKPSQPTSRETTPAKPIASPATAPTSRGWAVQVGSFASRATADRLVKDLAQQEQNAFVMPVKSGNATLYRVRVGPFADRAAANESLREVKGRIANAAVVAHP